MLALTFILISLLANLAVTSGKLKDFLEYLSEKELFNQFDATRILNEGEKGQDLKKLLQYKLQFIRDNNVTTMMVAPPQASQVKLKEDLIEDMGDNFKIYHSSQEKGKTPTLINFKFIEEILKIAKKNYQDPCARLADAYYANEENFFFPYEFVSSCYRNFDYNDTLAKETVDAIKSMLPFYVFLDLSARKINLTDPAIFNVSDGKDITFQEQLANRIRSLYDGHFVYKPKCYRTFLFSQPLFLNSVVDEKNRTRIFVPTHTELFGESKFIPELKKYSGWEVSKMDLGIMDNTSLCPASDIQIYSDLHNGVYRSTRTRYNSALSRSTLKEDKLILLPGDVLTTEIMPSSPYVTYRFLNSSGYETEDIQVPWVAIPNTNTFETLEFDNTPAYRRKYCLAPKRKAPKNSPSPTVTGTAIEDKKTPLFDDIEIFPGAKYEIKPKKEKKDPFFGDDLFEIIYLSAHFSIYGHKTTKVAVIHLFTFNIQDPLVADSWMFGLLKGFNTLHKKDYTKLLLDLSENSGGETCLASSFSQYIDRISDPNYLPERLYPEYTALRYSEELVEMSRQAKGDYNIFSERAYFYANGGKWDFTSASVTFNRTFTLPNRQKKVLSGKLVANLTKQCEAYYPKLIRSVKWRIKREDIILMSNAICGSACAVLLNALNRRGIKSIAVTSGTLSTDSPMSIQAFAGGEKVTSDTLLSATAEFKKNLIKPFPTTAVLEFTFRGVGMMQGGGDFRMLEYAMWPANAEMRISAENVFRPKLIWNTVITKAFSSDFKNYPIFQEAKNPKYSFFDVFDVPNLVCNISNILSFLLTWDNGNVW